MSVNDWECRKACVVFNPGDHFDRTKNGTPLPTADPTKTLIIDKDDRILVLDKIAEYPGLSWMVPIQPTTVADIEQKRIMTRNTRFAASALLDRCFDTHADLCVASDGPTVEDYQCKVQRLQQELEEVHLMHSQLYGAAHTDSKQLIASAHEMITDLTLGSTQNPTGGVRSFIVREF